MTELRFVQRTIPAPELGAGIGRVVKILQQRLGPLSPWEDVPCVEETEVMRTPATVVT